MNEIESILNKWDIGKIFLIKTLDRGEVNNNWLVDSERGKFVLRKAAAYRKKEEINFELKYLNFMREQNFSYRTPAPVFTKNKKYFIKSRGSYYWLYNFIPGDIKEIWASRELKQVAKMMAEFHKIVEIMPLKNKKPCADDLMRKVILNELFSFRKRIMKSKSRTKNDMIFLDEIKAVIPLLESLDISEYAKLIKYPIHRDLNPENLIWKNDNLVGVVDFDNVSQINDAFIKDIAIVIQYACSDKEHKLDLKKANLFIREYKKFKELSENEVSLIPIIITAGYIEDFSYAYWMELNDCKRAKSKRLRLYPKLARWHADNKNEISEGLLR